MKSKWLILALSSLAFAACQNSDVSKAEVRSADASNKEIRRQGDDLNGLRQDFISSILQANVGESPYDLYYTLRTVFFSDELVSFFGEANIYDETDNWDHFEAKTYYKKNGKFTPLALNDLFSTPQQKQFLKDYLEKVEKANQLTVCNPVDENYQQSVIVQEKSLLIVFQPKLGKCKGAPYIISIPYDTLKGQWNEENPIAKTLPQVLQSKSYTSTWDEDQFFIQAAF